MRSSAIASAFRFPTTTLDESPVLPAAGRQRRDEVPARARPARSAAASATPAKVGSLAVPELPVLRRLVASLRRTRDLDDDGVRATPQCSMRDKVHRPRVVPIVADESRTFGMEGMFRQYGIYSSVGQLYHRKTPSSLTVVPRGKGRADSARRHQRGGRHFVVDRRGTSYSTHDQPMIPFYIFYSMFGFQRIGDLAWAAGDMRSRGFLLGATSGRTTLNGEGLQHEDGSSQVAASFIPNCRSYDPTFGYEVATIIQDGVRRMLTDQEDVYYYITVMNENYPHPAMPEGARDGILRGMYLLRDGGGDKNEAARPTLRLRRDPARSAAAAELLDKRMERLQRRLERHQFQPAAARRYRRAPLEPAASR